jgi:hypothetical protein
MGIPLIPFALGAAMGTAAVYLLGDERTRRRIAEESNRVRHAVGDYVADLVAGRRTAHTDYTADRPSAPPDAVAADRERCEALTKAGQRCRAKTNQVVEFPREGGGAQEHGLCWRHAQAFERGEPLELAPAAQAGETERH